MNSQELQNYSKQENDIQLKEVNKTLQHNKWLSEDIHLPHVVQIQKWRHGKMRVSLISLKQMTHSLPSSMAS